MARTPDQHTRHNPEPRITANDLARYMVSTESGKIGIIRRARESVTPPRVRYREVRQVMRAHLADRMRDRRAIAAAEMMFQQKADDGSRSDFAREDARLSLDVLASLSRMRNQLGGYAFLTSPARQPALVLSGVTVPVNLDLLVQHSLADGEQIGGALFRLTKAEDGETEAAAAKRREIGLFAATLVHMQVTQNIAGNREPDYRLCMSIDVQCEEVHLAPRSYRRRAQNLVDACVFIAAMWDRV